MKRIFFALIIFISTFLFADPLTDLSDKPKMYRPLRSFCWDHLSENPQACSKYIYRKADGLEPELMQKVSSREYLIPDNDTNCVFQYCNKCKNLARRHRGLDREDSNFLVTICGCIEGWYSGEVGGDEEVPKNWSICSTLSIENQYFCRHKQHYFHFFEHFLNYCKQGRGCSCYWPQISEDAQKISDGIYERMKNLVMKSDLASLSRAKTVIPEFPYLINLSEEEVVRGLFTHAFFYSNYHQICTDLCRYLDKHTEFEVSKTQATIQDLYQLIDEIQPSFLSMYDECLEKHPHPKIMYERGMIHMHREDSYASLEDIQNLIEYAEKNKQENLLTSEMYHQEGTVYADLGMYDEAIEALNKAIQKNPKNKEAYFDRAEAYFEAGDFEQSLKDYLDSGLKPIPINKEIDINFYEFSLGFAPRVIVGAADSTVDFIPSLFNSASSLGRATWAFAGDPIQTSKDFVKAAHSCIEFIKSSSALETIGIIAPEIKDLVENWDRLKDRERGEKVGYIIGKYGVEIFIGGGIAKGVKAFRDLKRANNLLIFESMALSERNAAMIVSKTNEANAKAVAAWERAILAKGGVVTQANSIIGWKVGQEINNLTIFGKIPKWSTVRQRYWKNQAHFHPEKYKLNEHELKRMRKGLAPQRFNKKRGQWESMELHHVPSQKDGGLFDVIELWPDEHAKIDPNRYIRK